MEQWGKKFALSPVLIGTEQIFPPMIFSGKMNFHLWKLFLRKNMLPRD